MGKKEKVFTERRFPQRPFPGRAGSAGKWSHASKTLEPSLHFYLFHLTQAAFKNDQKNLLCFIELNNSDL